MSRKDNKLSATSSASPNVALSFALSKRSLIRNSLLNATGQVIPLLVGLVAIPVVVHALGTERMGLLTLAWAVMGYFSMLDLGIGRAITHLLAEKFGENELQEVVRPVWTALGLMAALGVLGGIAAGAVSPWFVYRVLEIPTSLRHEAVWAFVALAVSLPIAITNAGLSGVLIGLQRFDLLNALRIPLGISMFLAPVAVAPFSTNLFHICLALVATRAFFLLLYFWACFSALPALHLNVGLAPGYVGRLLRFGGWMTVSNAIGPLMVYMDRLLIGIYLSTTTVAYYAIPYEIVTKLWIVPAAIVACLFPAFAAAKSSDASRATSLFSTAATIVPLALGPVVLIVVMFAQEGLLVWLGADYARESTVVLQLLAVGVYFNSAAHVPFTLVQGFARPDLTAKLHAIELPIYLVVLVWLLNRFGINGIAMAWLARVTIDMAILFAMAYAMLPAPSAKARRVIWMTAAPLPLFAAGAMLEVLAIKIVFLCVAITALGMLIYFVSFDELERRALCRQARGFLLRADSRQRCD